MALSMTFCYIQHYNTQKNEKMKKKRNKNHTIIVILEENRIFAKNL